MRLPQDTRGQGAIGVGRYLLGLVVGIIVIWVVNAIARPILTMAGEQGSGQTATQGTAYMTGAVDALPLVVLLVSLFGIIVYAVITRQVAR